MNALLVQEVIDAVRLTPEDQLGTGTLVDNHGCLCALGVRAYQTLPDFREYVDQIRATGKGPANNLCHETTYKTLGYEDREGEDAKYTEKARTLQEIVNANDRAMYWKPSLKDSILSELQKLHDRIMAE